jgi:O-antigen/teichoic acid export membrane protein
VPQQLFVLPLAIRATTFPLLSRSWPADRAAFVRLLERLIEGSLLVAIPAAVVGIGLAAPLTTVLYGPGFGGAAAPFALLMLNFGFLFPGILIGEALIAAGFQRLNLAILMGSLPLLVLLLLTLVPAAGPAGAALSVLLCYAAIVVATWAAARARLGLRLRTRMLLFTGAGLLCGIVILQLARGLGTPAAVLAGIAAFAVLAVSQPATTRAAWALLRNP